MKIKNNIDTSLKKRLMHFVMLFSILVGQILGPSVVLAKDTDNLTNNTIVVSDKNNDTISETAQLKEDATNQNTTTVQPKENQLDDIETNETLPVNQDNAGIVLEYFELYNSQRGEAETTLFSGQQTATYVRFATTSSQGTQSYTIVLKFNKNYIKKDEIITSTPDSLEGSALIKEDNDGNYIVEYHFKDLTGGTDVSFPTKFIATSGPTPDGYQLPVTASIYAEGVDNPLDTKTINYTYKIKKVETEKQIKTANATFSGIDQEIVSGGEENTTNPSHLSEELSKLDLVTFRYHTGISKTIEDKIGNRDIETIIYRDTLPEDAVFLEINNPGWVYDSVSRVATYEVANLDDFKLGYHLQNSPELNLLFPNGKLYDPNTPDANVYTNKMQAEFIPKNKDVSEDTIVYEDSMTFGLSVSDGFSAEKKGWERIYNRESYLKKWEGPWDIFVTNPSDKAIENLKIIDGQLDDNLYFSKILLPKTSDDIFEGTLDIYTQTDNGEKVLIKENVSLLESEQIITLTGQVDKVFIEAHNSSSQKSILKPTSSENMKFKVTLYVKMKDPKVKLTTPYVFSNEAEISGNKIGGPLITKIIRSEDKLLIDPNETFHVRKNVKTENKTFGAGEKINVSLDLNANGVLPETEIKFTQMVDLLPLGTRYVPHSAMLNLEYGKGSYRYNSSLKNGQYEPDVIFNYKGTGRTALVWEILPVTATALETASDAFPYQINYQMEVTKDTPPGENINEVYVGWENNDHIKAIDASDSSKVTEDIFDLNHNGKTDDFISKAQGKFYHSPVKELISKKTVRGNLDIDYTLTPAIARAEIGTQGDYHLTIINNSDDDFDTFVLLDVLPHIGDKTVGINQLIGERTPRNSQFDIHLKGPVVVPEGYSVFYTTDSPTKNMEDYAQKANWLLNPTDYSQVKAFKIVLTNGFTLPVGKTVEFTVPFLTPDDVNLGRYGLDDNVNERLISTNSFGVSTSKKLEFTESNNASIELFKYKVEGYVFEDLDIKDGLKGTNDRPFKDYKVQLIDDSGNPVVGLNGKPIETKTDENGYYTMDVHRNGQYKIKILTPNGYKLLPSKDDKNGSHIIDAQEGTTDSFVLNIDQPIVQKNAGYLKEGIDIR
ncbi:SdrD B-like domain-containing protein, partial [Streptococcus sp. CSL10205-OR2]|uniref:SdrD B-like domain-containing protein n=1 Tax=Streptococcus sp. CSL10205-OR2 TaxID=2980558 RepID=UPI0021D7DC0C